MSHLQPCSACPQTITSQRKACISPDQRRLNPRLATPGPDPRPPHAHHAPPPLPPPPPPPHMLQRGLRGREVSERLGAATLSACRTSLAPNAACTDSPSCAFSWLLLGSSAIAELPPPAESTVKRDACAYVFSRVVAMLAPAAKQCELRTAIWLCL
jgi:hypothetical protein